MASRAGNLRRPVLQAIAKAFVFCDYLFFKLPNSKGLAVFVNKSRSMDIEPEALFAIGSVVASAFRKLMPSAIDLFPKVPVRSGGFRSGFSRSVWPKVFYVPVRIGTTT